VDDSFAKVFARIAFSGVARNAVPDDPAILAGVVKAVVDAAAQGEILGAIVRLVFEDALIHSDQDGHLDMAMADFAAVAKVPLAWIVASMAILERPDPASKIMTDGGRRIIRKTPRRDGWIVVNKRYYSELRPGRKNAQSGAQSASDGSLAIGHWPLATPLLDKSRVDEIRQDNGHPALPAGQAAVDLTAPLFAGAESFPEIRRRAFEAYWAGWPRKVKRERAEAAFFSNEKSGIRNLDDLAQFDRHFANAVRHYREVERREGLSKVPYGGTWFRNWRDERWAEHVDEFSTAQGRELRAVMFPSGQPAAVDEDAEQARLASVWERSAGPAKSWIRAHGRPERSSEMKDQFFRETGVAWRDFEDAEALENGG
jgi:hypothetical protein